MAMIVEPATFNSFGIASSSSETLMTPQPSQTFDAPVQRKNTMRSSMSSTSHCASSMKHQNSHLDCALRQTRPTGITGQPMKRIFFSPHPDDIAYSCFGTASHKTRCCSCASKSTTSQTSSLKMLGMATPPPSPQIAGDFRFDSKEESVAEYPSSSPAMSLSYAVHKETWKLYKPALQAEEEGLNLSGPRVVGSTSGDVIVTVFSTSRCANGEIGSRLEHSVHNTTTLRASEDEAFAREVNADLVWLGFPDSSARDESSRRPDLGIEAMRGAAGTPSENVKHAVFDDVRRSLVPIVLNAVSCGAQMYLPLGVGCHVDHWMVRVAVMSIINELVRTSISTSPEALLETLNFYEDLPYADQTTGSAIEVLAHAVLPVGATARLVPLTNEDWMRKQASVQAYASQMKPTILPSLYAHAQRLAQRGADLDPHWPRTVNAIEAAMSEDNDQLSSTGITAAERVWTIVAAKLHPSY